MKALRIGQFSQSPVLAVIQHFNLLPDYQIEITNVVSSPAQFEALMKDELDIALTSPDNVLLYGTTTNNPLKRVGIVDFTFNLKAYGDKELTKVINEDLVISTILVNT
jgi:ABC-type nitrate/sulfonate/bicarbonate transport system substrate-binding protein